MGGQSLYVIDLKDFASFNGKITSGLGDLDQS
jgi:hypothetical protein